MAIPISLERRHARCMCRPGWHQAFGCRRQDRRKLSLCTHPENSFKCPILTGLAAMKALVAFMGRNACSHNGVVCTICFIAVQHRDAAAQNCRGSLQTLIQSDKALKPDVS